MIRTTEDGFLNGRVRVRQPERGFRSGLDAIFLAAAVPARGGDDVLELGCGTGTASLCLAARVRDCVVEGVDTDRELVRLANENAALNHLCTSVEFSEGDVLDLPRTFRKPFDHVFTNPPFHSAAERPSPDTRRAVALHEPGIFRDWLLSAAKRVKRNGTLTAILRADRLDEAVASLGREGLSIFPLWPRTNEAAKRILVQVRRSARVPLRLLPGLVLHRADGKYTDEAEAVLRGEAAICLADYK